MTRKKTGIADMHSRINHNFIKSRFTMKSYRAISIILGLIALADTASAHGYMKSPRSRNFKGYKDGVWWGGDNTTPEKEDCPHCLNLGGSSARCGITGSHNYDYPKNFNGGALAWSTDAESTYQVGSIIDIETVITAHHKGHIEVKACPLAHPGEVASQECFDSHPLEFVSDELYHAPKHQQYPGRAYIAPKTIAINDNSGVSGVSYKFKFKLPNEVSGHVLLQWYYITGNSCTAEGYDTYDFPAGWESSAPTCTHIPADGVGVPEQFWNCGEVYVGSDVPSPNPPAPTTTPAPTPSPTNSPVASPTVTSPTPAKPPTDQSKKTIVGYYASWQQYDRGGIGKPENMDFTKVDRVNFAFFQPDFNGNLYGTDSYGDPLALFGPSDATGTTHCSWDAPDQKNCNTHKYEKGLISLVHEAGAEIYPSIGGWSLSDNFPVIAASATTRTNFANQCVDLIKDYGFDGIDIDWEYPGYTDHSGTAQDKTNFNLLLDEVRSKLDALGSSTGSYYGLTAALPCGPSHINNMDIPHVSNVLDELLLMAYDLHGPWDPITGVNAPLYHQGYGDQELSVDSCVQMWKNGGAPASKISLGLAFYGRSFQGASGLNQPHSGIDTNNWYADDGLPQYYNIMEKAPTMTTVRHEVSKTPYAFFHNGDGLVSYDDERSICEKTEYAIQNGLKGFLIWELTSDLMLDLSTPLLDMVNGKLANPSMDCESGAPETNAPSPTQTWSPTPAQGPTTANSPTKAPSPSSTGNCPSGYTGLLPSDTCSHFQHCVSGSAVGDSIACPPGLLFDNDIQVCNYDYSVWCNGTPPEGVPLCPTGYNGMIAVDDCTGYRHCSNGKVISQTQSCGAGLLYDEKIQNCNWSNAVTCGSSRRTKRGLRGSGATQ